VTLDPRNPTAIAFAIAELSDKLEEATDQYAIDIEQAAKSDAMFKRLWAEAMLEVIASAGGTRMNVAEKEARVEVMVNDFRVIAEVHEAQAKATKELLNSLRVRLDSCRSLGANVRAQS
jgi:hypothetical protein